MPPLYYNRSYFIFNAIYTVIHMGTSKSLWKMELKLSLEMGI